MSELEIANSYLRDEIKEISELTHRMYEYMNFLEYTLNEIKGKTLSNYEKAIEYRDKVLTRMDKLREIVDNIETKVNKNSWPIPTYMDLLFSI